MMQATIININTAVCTACSSSVMFVESAIPKAPKIYF